MNQTEINKEVFSNRILVLTKEGGHRENISKNLKKGGFTCDFISNYRNASQVINHTKPGILLHDWDAFDTDQNCLFHQMIAKMTSLTHLCRITYAKKLNPTIFATAYDTGIDRVITLTNLQLNICEEIRMARSAISNINKLQKLTRLIHSNQHEYSQSEIDQTVSEAYSQYPYDGIVKLEFGNLCFRNNKLNKALTIGEELLNQDLTNVRAMNLVSRIYMRQNKHDEALTVLENANILAPKNIHRLLELGDICIQTNQGPKARKYYEEAYESAPEDPNTIGALGKFEVHEGNQNAALEIFKKTMSEEEVAGFLNNAGIRAVRNSNIKEALKLYELAINSLKTNKYVSQLYFNMALAQKRLKNLEACRDYLKKSLEHKTDFSKAAKQLKEVEKLLKKKSA
ncbi:MAG: tetratricopeptide repeat protein [Oligoflexales bacterium]